MAMRFINSHLYCSLFKHIAYSTFVQWSWFLFGTPGVNERVRHDWV